MDAAAVDDQAARDWLFDQARQILRCETVGPDDYFLDLGGDSLVAPVLANRIEARFGVRPELESIFTLPFGELAGIILANDAASR